MFAARLFVGRGHRRHVRAIRPGPAPPVPGGRSGGGWPVAGRTAGAGPGSPRRDRPAFTLAASLVSLALVRVLELPGHLPGPARSARARPGLRAGRGGQGHRADPGRHGPRPWWRSRDGGRRWATLVDALAVGLVAWACIWVTPGHRAQVAPLGPAPKPDLNGLRYLSTNDTQSGLGRRDSGGTGPSASSSRSHWSPWPSWWSARRAGLQVERSVRRRTLAAVVVPAILITAFTVPGPATWAFTVPCWRCGWWPQQ